jgi:hypothetical protein
MLNAPIATFTTINMEKLIQSSITSHPIAQALLGMDLDENDNDTAEVSIADATSELTFRARDIAFVSELPQPIPEDVMTMFSDANVNIATGFAVGLNPQTTGVTSPLLVIDADKADFLIWWNEFGS